jgi:hypothetical protein
MKFLRVEVYYLQPANYADGGQLVANNVADRGLVGNRKAKKSDRNHFAHKISLKWYDFSYVP